MTKRFLMSVFATLLLISSSIYAQERAKGEPSTKLERFLAKEGRLIIRDRYEAGKLSGQYGTKITVGALITYEPGKEAEKIRGLRIEVEGGGRLERSNTSFLDMDEVESLSQAISYMLRLLEMWKGTFRERTEVAFSTKGGFNLGFFQEGTHVQAFASSGRIGAVSCFFPADDLPKLKKIIDKGNALLK